MSTEATIIINGHTLDSGQSTTIRVACTNYLSDLQKTDALGSDEMGIKIAEGYRQCLREILRMIIID